MLAALAGGRALPAGELARRAGVQPGTAAVHLRRLAEAGLIRDRRIHLAGALPAAITSVFLARGWLSDAPGRSLQVGNGYDDKIDEWLAT